MEPTGIEPVTSCLQSSSESGRLRLGSGSRRRNQRFLGGSRGSGWVESGRLRLPSSFHVRRNLDATGPAAEQGERTPRKNESSRWNAGKDLSFTPLRPERVVEVRYDHMEGTRFRHTAQFVRWRPDREPSSCTFDQLDEPVSYSLADILGKGNDQ